MQSYVINCGWIRGSDLASRLDALENAQIDDDPGQEEQTKQLPADATSLLDALRLLQKLATERDNMHENTEHNIRLILLNVFLGIVIKLYSRRPNQPIQSVVWFFYP